MTSRIMLVPTATLAILAGAAQSVAAQATASIRVTARNEATGAPVADALIRAMPGGRSCTTRGDGDCHLVVNPGRVEVQATAMGFATVTRTVTVAAGDSATIPFALVPAAVPLDPLIAVGTRALQRTVSTSPVPVDAVSSQLLEETGLPETWQQLQRLVPSVNTPHISLRDNHMRPVTLRGLPPHHVLVLVNGKRRHPAAGLLEGPSVAFATLTDLNAIPSSAIERIEILRDGASAQYGSDAIGGVVNIVLKSGARRDARAMFGTVYSSEGGRDFRDGRLFDLGTSVGVATMTGAYVTVSGGHRSRGATNRAYPDRREQYFSGDPRNGEPPRVSSRNGNGKAFDSQLFLSAAAPLAAGTEVYGFGGVANRNGTSHDFLFLRPRSDSTVRAIHPDGLLPVIESGILDLSAFVGMRGSLRGWRWDASSGWGGNRVAYRVRNSNNVSLGEASPTDFNAGRIGAQQWTSNLDVSRELRVGSLPLNVAGGLEYRVDRYRIQAGEPDSWRDGGVPILDGPRAGRPAVVGSQGMVGYRPLDEVSAHRSNAGLYLEAGLRPLDRLLLLPAVRAERYSDFGSTYDGKIAARLELVRGLAMRGSLSTGFRAPPLTQQYFSSTRSVVTTDGDVTTVYIHRTFPVHTAEAQLMGAKPLRPEQSLNRSVGLALDMARLPVLTIDVYRIDIDHTIGLSPPIRDPSIIRRFEENGMRGIGGGSYFANRLDTRLRGVDLVVSRAFLLSRTGVLRTLGGYNHSRRRVVRVAEPPPELAGLIPSGLSRSVRGIIENGQPRETIMLTLDYASGPFGLNLHNQRSGPAALLHDRLPELDQVVRPQWITDLRVSYRLRPRMQLAVSAANLFDVYPDEWLDFKDGPQGDGGSWGGIYRYAGALSPFGVNGRTLYVQLGFR